MYFSVQMCPRGERCAGLCSFPILMFMTMMMMMMMMTFTDDNDGSGGDCIIVFYSIFPLRSHAFLECNEISCCAICKYLLVFFINLRIFLRCLVRLIYVLKIYYISKSLQNDMKF